MSQLPFNKYYNNPPPNGIICEPKSQLGGFGNDPFQFVQIRNNSDNPSGTYERDDDGLYLKNDGVLSESGDSVYINTTTNSYALRETGVLNAGNCYWDRNDGLVISWYGPFGFQIAPDYITTKLTAPLPQESRPAGDYIYKIEFGIGDHQDVLVFRRIKAFIFCHGQFIPTPDRVLGAAMIDDNIVIAVANTQEQDKIYFGKFSDVIQGNWTFSGNVNLSNTSTRIHMHRDHVYSFSEDGLSFNTIVRFADISTDDTIINKVLVRGGLSKSGVFISVDAITKEDFSQTLTYTYTESSSGTEIEDGSGNILYVGSSFSTYTNYQHNYIYACGFFGNTESLLVVTNFSGNHSSSYSWNVNEEHGTQNLYGSNSSAQSTSMNVQVSLLSDVVSTSTFVHSSNSISSKSGYFDPISGNSISTFQYVTESPAFCDTRSSKSLFYANKDYQSHESSYQEDDDFITTRQSSFTQNIELVFDNNNIYSNGDIYEGSSIIDTPTLGIGFDYYFTTEVNEHRITDVSSSIHQYQFLVTAVAYDQNNLSYQMIGNYYDAIDNDYVSVQKSIVKSGSSDVLLNELFNVQGDVGVGGVTSIEVNMTPYLFKI